jgi:hypothetical protein
MSCGKEGLFRSPNVRLGMARDKVHNIRFVAFSKGIQMMVRTVLIKKMQYAGEVI